MSDIKAMSVAEVGQLAAAIRSEMIALAGRRELFPEDEFPLAEGQAERFDMLARVKHLPFPGGAIRTPMLVAAMLFYRMKDALS